MYYLVVFIVITFLLTSHCLFRPPNNVRTCLPKFHAWQSIPLCEYIPVDSFEAAVDENGEKKYIARILSNDNKSWMAPITLSEKNLALQDRFAEILVLKPDPKSFGTPTAKGFGWRRTDKVHLAQLSDDCCLVEGGYGYVSGKKVVSWIGRRLKNGVYYIGEVREPEWDIFYAHHPMIYFDEFGVKHGISNDFEVLAYDCCTLNYCRQPNTADCCFQILG